MYFYGSNLGYLARRHLGPCDFHLNKIGRGAPGNATYQISTSGPSGSEERFLNIFLCISMVRPKDPLARSHLGPLDLHLNKIGRGALGNATF